MVEDSDIEEAEDVIISPVQHCPTKTPVTHQPADGAAAAADDDDGN